MNGSPCGGKLDYSDLINCRQQQPFPSNVLTTAPWTSARCHRLLRPLSSKIASLRKAESLRQDPVQGSYKKEGITQRSRTEAFATVANVGTEWESSPRPRKKIKRTYSAKIKPLGSKAMAEQEGEEVVMPLLRNASIQLPLHLITGETDDCPSKATQLRQDNQPNRPCNRTAPSNRTVADGICKALEALLKATSPKKSAITSGCHSLLSLCLRRIPRFIREEQILSEMEHPEDDVDVSSEVYNDLENLGAVPSGGWDSMREVVRAHGVTMIREAIEEDLISLQISLQFIHLCLGFRAIDEAEQILGSMIATVTSWGPCLGARIAAETGRCNKARELVPFHSTYDQRPRPPLQIVMDAMEYFVSHTGRQGLFYRQLAFMLDRGLPMEFLSGTSMIGHWNGLIRSIVQEDDHAQSAAFLLRTAISRSYNKGVATSYFQVHDMRLQARNTIFDRVRLTRTSRSCNPSSDIKSDRSRNNCIRPNDIDIALLSTLFNVLTVLSAINLLRSSESNLDSIKSAKLSMGILHDLALEVQQALELSQGDTRSRCSRTLRAEPLHLALLAGGLAMVASQRSCEELPPHAALHFTTLASLSSVKELFNYAGSFICAIAQCCERARPGDAFNSMQTMLGNVMMVSKSAARDKPTQELCNSITLAAAFEFSEKTGQPSHLNWAMNVEKEVHGSLILSPKPVANKIPANSDIRSRTGYRWEEGICEWIAKSPASVLQKCGDVEAKSNGDCESADRGASSHKQALPLLSEMSACAMNRRSVRARGRRAIGARKGLKDGLETHEVRGCGEKKASGVLRLSDVYGYPGSNVQHYANQKACAVEDDMDELSTPDSSQEKPYGVKVRCKMSTGVKKRGWNLGRCTRDTDDELSR